MFDSPPQFSEQWSKSLPRGGSAALIDIESGHQIRHGRLSSPCCVRAGTVLFDRFPLPLPPKFDPGSSLRMTGNISHSSFSTQWVPVGCLVQDMTFSVPHDPPRVVHPFSPSEGGVLACQCLRIRGTAVHRCPWRWSRMQVIRLNEWTGSCCRNIFFP